MTGQSIVAIVRDHVLQAKSMERRGGKCALKPCAVAEENPLLGAKDFSSEQDFPLDFSSLVTTTCRR